MRFFSFFRQEVLRCYTYSSRFMHWLVLLCAILMLTLIYSLYISLGELVVLEQQRSEGMQLARELRAGCRELTNNAQAFVATGSTFAEQNYYNVLQVRRGNLPRPINQSIAPGERKSLAELLQSRVNLDEYELLLRALVQSDELAKLEQEAMHLAAGLSPDWQGNYTVRGEPDPQKAFMLLHDTAYQQAALSIVRPMDEFFTRVAQRTLTAVKAIQNAALVKLLLLCFVLMLFFASLMGASYYTVVRKDRHTAGALASYIYIVLILLAGISLPAWLTYSDARDDIVKAMEKRQTILCREIFRELQLRLDHATELVTLLSMRPAIVNFIESYDSNTADSAQLDAAMSIARGINEGYSDSEGIFLLGADGQIAASTEGPAASNYGVLLSPQNLENIQNGITVTATLDRGTSLQPVLAVPIRGGSEKSGKVLGAVAMVMRLDDDSGLWDGRLARDENMSIFMLNSDAKVVLSSNPDWHPGRDAANEPAGLFALNRNEGLQSYEDGQNSIRLGVYMRLPKLDWTLGVSSSQDLILSSVRRMLTRSLMLSSAVILLAITLVTLLFVRLLKSMRKSEERLDMIIQGAGIGTWDLDFVTDKFTYNDLWAQLNGLPPQRGERTLEWALSFSEEADRQVLVDMVTVLKSAKVSSANPVYSCEYRVFCDNVWSWRKVTGRVTERAADGSAIRIGGTTTDVHARKVADMNEQEYKAHLEDMVCLRTRELEEARNQALAATQVKSAFLSTVSHEIRTPMNAIIGFIHLFERANLQEKQMSYLDKMHLAANTLLSIINDVLDISKIEAQKMEIETTPFLLQPVIDGAKSIMDFAAREKNLSLTVDFAPDVPVAVQGDPTRLQQILLNLLSNAVKFTRQGTVHLAVRVLPPASEDPAPQTSTIDMCRLLFSVTDSGIGMTQKQIDRLFQPFMQADSSVTRKFGGTGLGLAICKQLTELMGGLIRVSSATQQGTTFYVELPMRVVDAGLVPSATRTASKRRNVVAAGGAPAKALVVDDNDINLEIAKAMLEAEGLTVDVAINGLEALEKLTMMTFDIVFMDMQMPVMGGVEATRKIRALALETGAEALRNLPVIAMTANAMLDDKKLCFEAGMNDHLSKPIEPERLRALLEQWLGL